MKFILLMFVSLPAFANPVGVVIRSNLPSLQRQEVQLGQSFTLPKATEKKDYWLTIKYFETCQEETHINSRRSEAVVVTVNKILEGDCRDETSLD